MARENFLINPPKRLRRKRRSNPIGELLVTVGANPSRRNPMRRLRRSNPDNPWRGDSGGHRIAALMRWGKLPQGKIKRYRKRGRPSLHPVIGSVRKRVKKHVRRAHVSRRRHKLTAAQRYAKKVEMQSFWATKYGHMLSHPKSHKVYTRKGFVTMRRRKHRANSWFGQPRRHRKAAKKGWRRGHKGVHRRRKYRSNPGVAVSSNPRHRRRHRRSSYRRNPSLNLGRFTSQFTNVRSWAPLAVTGAASAITGAVVPSMVGIVNPWGKLGAQLVIAIGGGLAVEKFVDARHGQAWMVVGVSMVGYQLLKQFVLMPYLPQFAVGLGAYNDYSFRDGVSQEVGAFPSAMNAFPTGMHGYPGVGADEGAEEVEDMVGAYPYDGSPY